MPNTPQAHKLADEYHMLSREEVDVIADVAAKLPQGAVVVNIGAGVGTSCVAFLEAHPTCVVFSIDKRPKPEEIEAVRQAGFGGRHFRVMGHSAEIGRRWPLPAHAVFVDGAHDDGGVTADIRAWLPRVKRGGYILFHDYHHPNLPRLSPIVDKFMGAYERVGLARYLVAFRV